MIRLFGLAFVAMLLVACAAPAPVVRATTLRDTEWVAALAKRPDGDADRQCVRNALQIAFALIAYKDGDYDDRSIQRAMLDNIADKRVRALREAAVAEWLRTHEPSFAATAHLSECLADNGNRLPASDIWPKCLLAVEPATLFSIYRRAGSTLTDAVRAVTPHYRIDVNPSLIAELGQFVFNLTTEADDLRFREDLFADCVADAE